MKKVVLVLSFVFVFMFSSSAYAMSYEQFIEYYPNEYIYRVNYPTGAVNYFSSPVEIEFSLESVEIGKALVVRNPTEVTIRRLTNDGSVRTFSCPVLTIMIDHANGIGFEGDIDIYRWSGTGFFLPLPSTFLKGLSGPIQMTLLAGCGIMSGVLLVKLLTGYFRSYLNRSL